MGAGGRAGAAGVDAGDGCGRRSRAGRQRALDHGRRRGRGGGGRGCGGGLGDVAAHGARRVLAAPRRSPRGAGRWARQGLRRARLRRRPQVRGPRRQARRTRRRERAQREPRARQPRARGRARQARRRWRQARRGWPWGPRPSSRPLLGRLRLLGLLVADQPFTLGLATHAVALGLDDARRVALGLDPSASHRSSVSLLVSPSSLANSWMRIFAGKWFLCPSWVVLIECDGGSWDATESLAPRRTHQSARRSVGTRTSGLPER